MILYNHQAKNKADDSGVTKMITITLQITYIDGMTASYEMYIPKNMINFTVEGLSKKANIAKIEVK
jgi:hypothetical protein